MLNDVGSASEGGCGGYIVKGSIVSQQGAVRGIDELLVDGSHDVDGRDKTSRVCDVLDDRMGGAWVGGGSNASVSVLVLVLVLVVCLFTLIAGSREAVCLLASERKEKERRESLASETDGQVRDPR